MDSKSIAKIQIALGIVIFILAIISFPIIFKNVYVVSLTDGVYSITSEWDEVANNLNTTSTDVGAHVVSNIVIFANVVKLNLYLFGVSLVILIVLSLIFILQGLYNYNKK
jgi:hypothetical protein